jgi:hypothetical protein
VQGVARGDLEQRVALESEVIRADLGIAGFFEQTPSDFVALQLLGPPRQ